MSGPCGEAPPGTYARLTVADTSTAMSPDVAERIFKPSSSTKSAENGTGRGLNMVFGFDSDVQRVGDGAVSVLVVGDGPAVQKFVQRILERCGYHVIMAESGGEAIALQEKHADEMAEARRGFSIP